MIVLDTHAWLWWIDDSDRLSKPAREAIGIADRILVSSVCAWEVAMLIARGRISLDRDAGAWIARALALPQVEEVPLNSAIALAAVALPDDSYPADPADRFIVATAKHHRAALVTRDEALRAADPLGTVW